MITGHREKKLIENGYDIKWISNCIEQILTELEPYKPLCYSGMADGIDLIFCDICRMLNLPYIVCIPFKEQDKYMSPENWVLHHKLIEDSKEVKEVKNSWMVENIDTAIVVFDGNKGGTANVFQQLIEKRKNFYWINPVGKTVWKCFI